MASGVYNFQNTARSRTACEQGATFRRKVTLLDPDRVAVNLAGYTARMQIRDPKRNTLICSLTTENGRISIDAENGVLMLEIGATVTETLQIGLFLYDLELVASVDSVTRLLEGKFQVTRNVTL